ncbi:ECF transporter S component [bacterium]|nr:ECF transporter S component [bacterium]
MDSNPDLMRMPGPAKGAEALGFAASLLILALVLTYFSHRFGIINRSIIPMHAPVLLGGMILSPVYAAVVGLLIPAVSAGLTGYPTYGESLRWMIELGLCGGATALVFTALSRNKQSAKLVEWIVRGMIATIGGLLASLIGYMIISINDVGNTGFGYFVESFFASSYLTFIVVLIAVPALGLKLRKSAHH